MQIFVAGTLWDPTGTHFSSEVDSFQNLRLKVVPQQKEGAWYFVLVKNIFQIFFKYFDVLLLLMITDSKSEQQNLKILTSQKKIRAGDGDEKIVTIIRISDF